MATLSLLTSRKSRADDPDLEKGEGSIKKTDSKADEKVEDEKAAAKLKGDPEDEDEEDEEEPRQPLHLLALPNELKLMLLNYLEFADIERLRRTCKEFRELANPRWIRTMYGEENLRRLLLGHCKVCLRHDPFRSTLLRADPSDPAYPLASYCLGCAVKQDDQRIRIGKRVQLASFDNVWVCRWCGLPITEGAAYGHEQFHRSCYKRYNDVLFYFFILGWVQLGLGTAGTAMSIRFYRNELLIFAPALTSFLLLWICLTILLFRGNRFRTYIFTLFIELAVLGLWIPPLYRLAKDIAVAKEPSKIDVGTLSVYAFNMLFRMVNVLGNIVLATEYDITLHDRPHMAPWRRFVNPLISGLIFWTYPQSLEQKYPPDYY
ncbi:hypothetical protein GQ53DRAFT_696760 [Thozetella sp. PMI_491]|nr:hypothetical protein GQ53DRAFT_696760 [Thozetella sp. PMI_491]